MSEHLAVAFAGLLTDPMALGLCLLGTVIGIVFGALPGIGSTMSMAVLLPVTFAMPPEHSMAFLMGVFSGSVYGGSISAILVNIPGTAGAMVTQLDGYPMARNGRAGEAMTYALLASGLGGIIGWVLLMATAPVVARAASQFQSPDFAAVAFFGLAMVAYSAPGSTLKAFIAGLLGLLLSTVGLDRVTDVWRFEFGLPGLQSGLDIIVVVVGIFGLAEVLTNIEFGAVKYRAVKTIGRIFPPWREARRMWPMVLRGSVAGVVVGAIPAAGSAIGVSIAYANEKRLSKTPEKYGTGIPEGIVAPESSNNACVGGALIPMMTLGIPGDTMTAVLIGALLIHGLQPGPDLFTNNAGFVAVVYAALLIAIVFQTMVGLLGIRLFAHLMRAPKNVLMTLIALVCVVGAYAVRNSLFDVGVTIAFGALGFLMQRIGMAVAPLVFGLILGPMLEDNIRRTLIVHGDWSVFLRRPIATTLIVIALFTLIYPPLKSAIVTSWVRRRQKAGGEAETPR
jgi:putative tricarboxylic transport membrane protein